MPEKLKPCPVCEDSGNTLEVYSVKDGFQVICWNCFMRGTRRRNHNEAIKEWNDFPRRLRWSKVPPKEPGWYWWRWCKGAELVPLYVRDELIVEYPRQSLARVADIGGEWAGPIPEPEE